MPRWPLWQTALVVGIVLLVVLALLSGIHYYFWARLVRDTALRSPWRALALWTLVTLAVLVPLGFFLFRFVSPAVTRFALLPSYVWMGLLFLLLLTLGLADALRGLWWLASHVVPPGGEPASPERRLFLARAINGAAGAAALVTGGIALESGRRFGVKEIRVTVPRLPRAAHGTTIVQLTDIHVGPTIGRDFVEEIVARTNALSPDLVAITGDLVDGAVAHLRPLVAPLQDLKPRLGVYFVTGNHEYYSGPEEWCAELTRMRIRVLRNERVVVGEGDASFDLAGIDDHEAARYGAGGPDLAKALAGRDPSRACVLLAHQPKAIDQAADLGVGLQLSGHTHGGQIWPFRYIVRLTQPYVDGLHDHRGTWIYVSNGTGYWGPPMRLATPAEITKVTMESGAA